MSSRQSLTPSAALRGLHGKTFSRVWRRSRRGLQLDSVVQDPPLTDQYSGHGLKLLHPCVRPLLNLRRHKSSKLLLIGSKSHFLPDITDFGILFGNQGPISGGRMERHGICNLG
ncbi:hypothetical protein AMECASPLE_028101 [Ameca splendens]|uniref:Uncharacterized protein n=1 Tax=Ameca splendens TaxID=208324 RepID=A0ABV0XUC1_9TELE